MIAYNIKYLSDFRYCVQWRMRVPGKESETFSIHMSVKTAKLDELVREAKQRICCTLNNKSYKDKAYMNSYRNNQWRWDGDATELPPMLKAQAAQAKAVMTGEPQPIEEPERLFYIEFYSDGKYKGPRLRKLEKPLMTWEQACKALREKVA